MSRTSTIRIAGALAALALVLALTPAASAQCAMCANAAAAQKAEARKALNTGIAVLVAPVLLLFGGIVVISYKRRNPPDDLSLDLPAMSYPSRTRTVVNLPLEPPSDPPHTSP